MRFLIFVLLMLPIVASAKCKDKSAQAGTKAAKEFGKGIQLTEAPLSLGDAARNLSAEKEVVIQAKIAMVCQHSGCWVTLKDGETQARVTYGHAFFLPKSAGKKTVLVQGKIFEKEISAEEARHYAKDAGLSKKEIAKIKGPQKSLWVEATGVKLL